MPLMDLRNLDFIRMAHDAKSIEQPNHYAYDDDHVEDFLNLAVHWDVSVDQPEHYSDDDQRDDQRYKRHKKGPMYWTNKSKPFMCHAPFPRDSALFGLRIRAYRTMPASKVHLVC